MVKNRNILKNFLNEPKTVYVIGSSLKDMFFRAIDIITDNEKEYKSVPEEVVQTNRALLSELHQIDNTPEFLQFLKLYAQTLSEWNKNTFNIDIIENISVYLINYAEDNLTVNELMSHFDLCSNLLLNLLNVEKQVFKLSDHYFGIIREEE